MIKKPLFTKDGTTKQADQKAHFRERWGFKIDNSGVFKIDREGKEKDRWICPLLHVDARSRDFNGEGCGKLVRFCNEDGQEKTLIIPHSALIGDGTEPLERLLDAGFKPSRERKNLEAVKDYIYQSRPNATVRCVSSVGWHNGFFVLPNRSFGPMSSTEDVRFSEMVDHKYNQAGTLDEWKRNVGRLCAGNSRLIFAVCCAFAAPLLELVKADNGGFHFRGLSSIGKSTALLVGGSVWGGKAQTGFLQTWRATANGIEARAVIHNDALLCLDEISEVSEREVGEIVYTLGNGSAKGRMTRHITSRASTPFKLLFLSSGERTLREILQAAGKQSKGGQESRLIDIPADAGKGKGLFEQLHEHATADGMARALSQAAKTYYGSAIDAFLRAVVANSNEIGEDMRRERDGFLLKHVPRDASGEVSRAGSLFGLVAAAGELATSFGLTGWEKGAAIWAVETCFDAWIQNRGGTGAHDVESGIEAVRSFLELHGPSRFEDIKETSQPKVVYERAGFREKVQSDDGGHFVYYIHKNVFQNEVCRGYDYRSVAKELHVRGHLHRHEQDHLSVYKRVPGQGRFRCFAVLPSIFGGPECEDLQETAGTSGTRIAVA